MLNCFFLCRRMLGPDFHESVPPEASLWVPGSAGISLHAGPYGGGYTVRGDGALACEQVNVAWQLRDVTAADGGFVSSHTRPICRHLCGTVC